MPTVYDDIAQQSTGAAPAPPRSVYDDIADEEVKRANQQAQQSLATTMDTNPDQAGEAQRISAKIGVGPDVALHQMDDARKQAALQDVQARDLASWNPMLARQLSDPNFAAISHDQVDNLSNTGALFTRMKDALAHPIDQLHSEANDITSQYGQG
jgi:hypothetical protein